MSTNKLDPKQICRRSLNTGILGAFLLGFSLMGMMAIITTFYAAVESEPMEVRAAYGFLHLLGSPMGKVLMVAAALAIVGVILMWRAITRHGDNLDKMEVPTRHMMS